MTDYEEFLVPVEIAEALKKIGFDKNDEKVVKLYDYKDREIVEPTWEVHYRYSYFSHYLDYPNKYCPLFTYEQVFAWFRSNGLFHSITIEEDLIENNILFKSEIRNTNADIVSMFTRDTYEEARKDLLKRLIKI